MAVDEEAGIGYSAHRLATASDEQAQQVTVEISPTGLCEMRHEQHHVAEQNRWDI
jgi:predicted O-methyltransferase YrrM